MAETKQLVLVVEGTSALGPHWHIILSDYLEKIIRSLSVDEDNKPDSPAVEMALVNFNVHGSYSSCLTQRSGWTKNMDMFLEWLSAINFSGGGFCDAAIAQGLAEVLMMFPSVNGIQNHQRHCILVAASNPYPLPTPVYIPPDYVEMQSDGPLSDAETVAKYFKKGLVSLSVICPRQLPKLKAIYNEAKRSPSETDPTIHTVKNPNYLVLISESFMEARTTLSQPEIKNLPSNQSPTEMDVTPVSEPPQTSISPVTESPLNQQPKTPPATEPNTVCVMVSAETSSPLSTSQEMTTSRNDNLQNLNPVTSSGQTESATLPGTSTTTNVVNDNVATTVGPTQQTSSGIPSEPARYTKLWVGDLIVERQGKSNLITKLEGYRNTKSSVSLAKDWPTTLQLDRIIPEDEMKNKTYTGKVDYIIFKAMNEQSPFLKRLQEKKLSMVINLPSQMLFLAMTADKVSWMVGKLLPKECLCGIGHGDDDGGGGEGGIMQLGSSKGAESMAFVK